MDTSKVVTAQFTSRPRLEIVRCLGGLNREGFELTVTGDLGARYRIQATNMLADPSFDKLDAPGHRDQHIRDGGVPRQHQHKLHATVLPGRGSAVKESIR